MVSCHSFPFLLGMYYNRAIYESDHNFDKGRRPVTFTAVESLAAITLSREEIGR
jgi:hypothetical protein